MKLRSVIILAIIVSFAFTNTLMAQTAPKQPFITRTITKMKDGMIETLVKTPDGQVFGGVFRSENMGKILFFINGKSYDEEEVQQLDPTLYKNQHFSINGASNYEIEDRDPHAYTFVISVGEPPPLSSFTINSLAV